MAERSDPDEGNKLVFKPSPLQARKKRPPFEVRGELAGPQEVTAVPRSASAAPAMAAAEPSDAAAAPRPPRQHRNDVTTISFEPLPELAKRPAPEPEPEPTAEAAPVQAADKPADKAADRPVEKAADKPADKAAAPAPASPEEREKLWTYAILAALAIATLLALSWLGLF